MRKPQNKFDATPSMLGFLYQTRFALLLALRRNDPDVLVSIEKIDDIAFAKDNGNGFPVPFDLRQLKHHLTRQGGLSDRSADVWKTLRVWAEAVSAKKLNLSKALLFLVSTSKATKTNAVWALSPDLSKRDSELAQKQLEAAGAASTDRTVKEAFKAVSTLSEKKRTRFFSAIHVLDGSLDIEQLRMAIEGEVRLLTDPQHRVALADALEGWWFRRVIEHLMRPLDPGVLVRHVEEQVSELREQFRRVNLPDELVGAPVPETEKKDKDTRVFVRQLRLIKLAERRIRPAQEDHYRAYEQRSRWIRQHLLGMDELHKLEVRLIDEWQRRFDIMLEGLDPKRGEDGHYLSGQALYQWIELDAPQNQSLLVRPEFRSPYMTRGSYHMLADKKRVGWHPYYDTHLTEDGGDTDAG
jgi:hypothetical protein